MYRMESISKVQKKQAFLKSDGMLSSNSEHYLEPCAKIIDPAEFLYLFSEGCNGRCDHIIYRFKTIRAGEKIF